eukprot:5672816-Prymnesium_polylepis.2
MNELSRAAGRRGTAQRRPCRGSHVGSGTCSAVHREKSVGIPRLKTRGTCTLYTNVHLRHYAPLAAP